MGVGGGWWGWDTVIQWHVERVTEGSDDRTSISGSIQSKSEIRFKFFII